MRKNHELFWLFEVLLLTPIAFFWSGMLEWFLAKKDTLLMASVGKPIDMVRGILITIILPIAAVILSIDYLQENKKDKSSTKSFAKYIIVIGTLSVVVVLFYLYTQNFPDGF